MSFTGKVVIITGASSGIGASAAELFSKEGAHVVIVGRNQDLLAASAAQCNSPLVVRADITIESEAQRVVDETIKKFGQIDILVNNAGGIPLTIGLLEDGVMKAYDDVMNLNLRSVVHLTTLAAPHLIKTKGNIVNISSTAGVTPPFRPGVSNYCVAKAGLNHFTVCAAVELGSYGVRVNAISPGPVRTNFKQNSKSPGTYEDTAKIMLLKRVSEPEEIADLILFLASSRAKSVTGVNWYSDNGCIIQR
ncbi:3-oxoacyl-[acyl-carrier-protein] reductase FabG-like [Melitaea cinxia]|uniref:3-oxoacyl-[acyl-carrier-protein] reductase FabG-like n=1 Tax=Melitaea cinxia TaxID=113334 RepID=UPI001E271ADC|nr:3-oxoacyl-[acyl-carrier-protein] reductase FabG-like [Melitaea cinxia]